MNRNFESVLWLDDMRSPSIFGIDWVKNYDEFVWHLKNNPMPELISFDHDLDISHYPIFEENPTMKIPYDSYAEKTGYHCARFVVENNFPVKFWAVHSQNSVGRANIQELLRWYCPEGEVRGLRIPYTLIRPYMG